MIISKTPLRISFAGGTTDIPEFYENNDYGSVTSATIDKYIYVTVNKRFEDKFRIAYKKYEEVKEIKNISHPIIRSCLEYLNINEKLEITTIADVPGGTGLGSSSAFTVGLLNALHRLYGHYKNPMELAEEACHIELNILNRPMGKQDAYAAAFGGFNYIKFKKDSVDVTPIYIRELFIKNLERELVLFYLNTKCNNRDILRNQIIEFKDKNELLMKQRELSKDAYNILKQSNYSSNFKPLGKVMDTSWLLKRQFVDVTNKYIDDLYNKAYVLGANGGKVCGAGSRGFLMLHILGDTESNISKALMLKKLNFKFEREGSKIIYED